MFAALSINEDVGVLIQQVADSTVSERILAYSQF